MRDATPNEQKSHANEESGAICECGEGLRECAARSNPWAFINREACKAEGTLETLPRMSKKAMRAKRVGFTFWRKYEVY
ncbi:hypothetical protein BRYFOR_09848 [Marvinbryantia formatexigens DSM 14469]|uniref:Uncharacterized protein n=1 Tax=Marvinbryantia formatexigens DSM 14469 TaxID=478749 RepID=C6LME8_9FIRM|nr:hypothetical protein BRYFOR_09848 [Marvinbryantia formatexigens DSM 14469]